MTPVHIVNETSVVLEGSSVKSSLVTLEAEELLAIGLLLFYATRLKIGGRLTASEGKLSKKIRFKINQGLVEVDIH